MPLHSQERFLELALESTMRGKWWWMHPPLRSDQRQCGKSGRKRAR